MATKRTIKRPAAAAPVRRRRTYKPPAVKRRAPVRRSKGLLSDMFNPSMMQASAKTVMSGAVGGGAAALMDKFLSASDPNMAAAYKLVGGFVFSAMLKMPNVGAGLAGVGVYQLIQNSGMLNDDGDWGDDIERLPMVLNDDNGYLQEAYLQDSYLQDENPGWSYAWQG